MPRKSLRMIRRLSRDKPAHVSKKYTFKKAAVFPLPHRLRGRHHTWVPAIFLNSCFNCVDFPLQLLQVKQGAAELDGVLAQQLIYFLGHLQLLPRRGEILF